MHVGAWLGYAKRTSGNACGEAVLIWKMPCMVNDCVSGLLNFLSIQRAFDAWCLFHRLRFGTFELPFYTKGIRCLVFIPYVTDYFLDEVTTPV